MTAATIIDPYRTWDDALAIGQITDAPDGLPDRAIVPLIERLRADGIITLQSCAGHPGESDGVLWIADTPTVRARLAPLLTDPTPFTYLKRTHHPQRQWEIGWLPADVAWAMGRLEQTLTR